MRTLTLALALAAAGQDKDEWPAGGEKDGLELSVKVDQTVTSGKDPLAFQVRLRNKTDGEKKVTFHHDLARSLSIWQGTSELKIIGAGCACGAYEAGAVHVTLKAGESRTCTVRAYLLSNKGRHQIGVHGPNIRPVMGAANLLEITIQ